MHEITKSIPYMLSLYSSTEMKKPTSKHEPIIVSLSLLSNKPFDTFKAQVLPKISQTLNPTALDFSQYHILYNIPHVVTKPGYPASDEASYKLMLKSALKAKDLNVVNLLIESQAPSAVGNKENETDNETANQKKKSLHPNVRMNY